MEFLLKNPQQWIVGQMYKIKFATYIESDEEMRIQVLLDFSRVITLPRQYVYMHQVPTHLHLRGFRNVENGSPLPIFKPFTTVT